MRTVPMPDDYVWANYGLRPPTMREIQVVRTTLINGVTFQAGDVVAVTERDALVLIGSGKAVPYPPPQAKEESPEELAERRRKALGEGPYKVEVTHRCQVKGYTCEPGEIICLDEEGAMCLMVSGRGKIISKPGEEDIMGKIRKLIEEKLRVG